MLETGYITKIIEIVDNYGKRNQVGQAIEEMSELTVELNKNINRNKDNVEDITKEIADVMIMLMQLLVIYDISTDAISIEMQKKIDRQIKRIQNEKDTQGLQDKIKELETQNKNITRELLSRTKQLESYFETEKEWHFADFPYKHIKKEIEEKVIGKSLSVPDGWISIESLLEIINKHKKEILDKKVKENKDANN